MSHQSILALLDAELSRLRQARALLSEPSAKTRRGLKLTHVPTEEPTAALSEANSTAPQAKLQIVPAKGPRVSRRGFRQLKKAAPDVSSRALGGTVPSGPVYVSAGQLRDAQKQPTLPGDPAVSSGHVTAEMLAQRWLRSTT